MVQKRVLVADDEKAIARLVQVTLEKAGMSTVVVYDGQAALDEAQKGGFDAVVLDVMMPHRDGFEVLRLLRMEPATQELPVLMLTAKVTDGDIFTGYSNGAHMYLTKPFDPSELLSFVKRLVLLN